MSDHQEALNQHPKNILLAVDGSFQSFETVRYVSRVLAGGQLRITLFHVMCPMPESFWDLEHDPEGGAPTAAGRAWRDNQKRVIEHFMERALHTFHEAGYPRHLLPVVIRERQKGVARDIAAEARRGYEAVVLGRRGTNILPEMVLGGVANKISSSLKQQPVWIVGGTPETRRVLIAMDPSRGAMRALEHAGDMVATARPEVLLLHVQRTQREAGAAGGSPRAPGTERAMEAVLEEGKERLAAKGIDPAGIDARIIRQVESRAVAITDVARREGFGTIVVGRRGLTNVREFDMGRVASKVLQMARDSSVWIVS